MISYISLEITWRHGGRSMGAPEAPRKKQQEKKNRPCTLSLFHFLQPLHSYIGHQGQRDYTPPKHEHTRTPHYPLQSGNLVGDIAFTRFRKSAKCFCQVVQGIDINPYTTILHLMTSIGGSSLCVMVKSQMAFSEWGFHLEMKIESCCFEAILLRWITSS